MVVDESQKSRLDRTHYLSYAAWLARRQLPANWARLPLAIGTQFPDLVDKPLAYLDILTDGRSFAHSLFTLIVITTILWTVARRSQGRWSPDEWQDQLRQTTPFAFTIGYAGHLLGDAWGLLVTGNSYAARWLLWPLYSHPASPADQIAPWTASWPPTNYGHPPIDRTHTHRPHRLHHHPRRHPPPRTRRIVRSRIHPPHFIRATCAGMNK